MTARKHDPITLEIIRNSVQAAADEMFAAMRKTAMSSIIYEVLDMGTGILDAKGEIASSGAGITPAMSIRFGAFFGQSDQFWHGLQVECDFRKLAGDRHRLINDIQAASTLQKS